MTPENVGQQFAAMHPNLTPYRDGGMGGDGPDHSVVGYVKTSVLRNIPGNSTTPEGIERHRQAIRSGQGFDNPVLVVYDHKSGKGYVGEGNHRVAAAAAEGVSHVPARVVRGWSSEMNPEPSTGHFPGRLQADKPTLPWKGGLGEEYVPSDIHPKHVFNPRDVV